MWSGRVIAATNRENVWKIAEERFPKRHRPALPPGLPQHTIDGRPGGGAGRCRNAPKGASETRSGLGFGAWAGPGAFAEPFGDDVLGAAAHLHPVMERRRIEQAVGPAVVPGEQLAGFGLDGLVDRQIGRASCRERVCQYV